MTKPFFILVILLLGLWAGLPAQVSYDHWDFIIRAQNSIMTDSLARIGVRSDATPGFDNVYDIPRPPRAPSGVYLEVYFPHSGGNYPPLLGSKYGVDFQGPPNPAWNMNIESSISGPILVFWDSTYVRTITTGVQLFLYDVTAGVYVNMRSRGSYTFEYSTRRNFQIVGAVQLNVKYLMEGFWRDTTQVQDTVTAYLAQMTAPYLYIDSAAVYLSSDGTGLFVFQNAPSGDYYLVMKHRDHLTVWSANTISVAKGTTSQGNYDFSSSAEMAFGVDALKNAGAVYVSWGGDVNQDGVVDFLDRNLTWNDRGHSGYLTTDCNGDNITDPDDYTIVLNNRFKYIQKP